MAVDLNALREDIKPHDSNLLKKQSQPLTNEQLVEFMDQVDSKIDQNKPKVGRPKKKIGEALKSRQTLLLTKDQKDIIERRRGANNLGEIDSSTFIREWLTRTGCFDTSRFPIKENPQDNLPS